MTLRERHLGWTLVWRLAGCAALFWAGWHWLGPIGLLFASPVLGVAVAWPLLDLAGRGVARVREGALTDADEDLYEFHGHPLRVLEDDDGHRWLRTDEVRRIVTGLPRDALLKHLYGDDIAVAAERGATLRVRAERLDAALADAQANGTVRFRRWLQREVIGPAERLRQRRGCR